MATQTIDYNINVNAGGSLRTIQDIENELNELNQEIKEVGVGSAAFDKAAGNIQKLESELRQTQSTVEGFTLDKKLETADGAIKVVAGSVTALTGVLRFSRFENFPNWGFPKTGLNFTSNNLNDLVVPSQ